MIFTFRAVVEMVVDVPSESFLDSQKEVFQDLPVGCVLKGDVVVERGDF